MVRFFILPQNRAKSEFTIRDFDIGLLKKYKVRVFNNFPTYVQKACLQESWQHLIMLPILYLIMLKEGYGHDE